MRAHLIFLACAGVSFLTADRDGTAVASPPSQAGYGTIKGRLVWGGASSPELPLLVKKGENVKDGAVCATTDLKDRSLDVDSKTKGIAHAFAYLAQPKGKNPEAEQALLKAQPTVVIDQKNCEFLPYATAMHQAQQIVFKSSDPVGHNVRYNSLGNGSKSLMLGPNSALPSSKFKVDRRPIPLVCDIHPWMKGYIMVFDHPFFAVTRADGSFEISGVPEGAQKLVILMPEKVGYVTTGAAQGMAVSVKAGETTDVGEIKLDPAKIRTK